MNTLYSKRASSSMTKNYNGLLFYAGIAGISLYTDLKGMQACYLPVISEELLEATKYTFLKCYVLQLHSLHFKAKLSYDTTLNREIS